MKVAVIGEKKNLVEREVHEYGLKLDSLSPDVVIAFGDYGSTLTAEQIYPGIPTLFIEHSEVCEKCEKGEEHDFSEVLKKLGRGKYKVVSSEKVKGIVNEDEDKVLVGLNEINIHHGFPTKTMRFSVSVDGKFIARDLVGDGVIVATPYGSNAYFYSIAERRFKKGLGIAFNNTGRKKKSRVVRGNPKIEVKVIKGPGLMCADNNTSMIPLKDGDVVAVRKADEKAKWIEIGGKRKIVL